MGALCRHGFPVCKGSPECAVCIRERHDAVKPAPAEATVCTCGSGGHPRRCAVHPDAFDQHVALRAELNEMRTKRDQAVDSALDKLEKALDDLDEVKGELEIEKYRRLDVECLLEKEQAEADRLRAELAKEKEYIAEYKSLALAEIRSREAVPALLEDVERLRAELAQAHLEIDALDNIAEERRDRAKKAEAELEAATNGRAHFHSLWMGSCKHVAEACRTLGVDEDQPFDTWSLLDACVQAKDALEKARAELAEHKRLPFAVDMAKEIATLTDRAENVEKERDYLAKEAKHYYDYAMKLARELDKARAELAKERRAPASVYLTADGQCQAEHIWPGHPVYEAMRQALARCHVTLTRARNAGPACRNYGGGMNLNCFQWAARPEAREHRLCRGCEFKVAIDTTLACIDAATAGKGGK